MKSSGIVAMYTKKISLEAAFKSFYLVLRDYYLSKILFFENLVM